MQEEVRRSSRFWKIVSRHYALLAACIYVFAAIVGTAYYAFLFDYFDLAIFDYWEPSDVLLAALRQPVSILLGIVAVLLAMTQIYPDEYNDWLKSKSIWLWKVSGNYYTRKWGWTWSPGAYLGSVFGLMWFLIVIMAVAYQDAKSVWKAEIAAVHLTTVSNEMFEGRVISTTSKYLILLLDGAEKDNKRTLAVPVEAVSSVWQCADKGGFLRRALGRSVCKQAYPAATADVESADGKATPAAEDRAPNGPQG